MRIAEILKSRFNYEVKILTSNAIDFKALRSPKGKIVKKNNKFFSSVNNLEIERLSINYDKTVEQKMKNLEQFGINRMLNLPNAAIKKLLHNGPYLNNVQEHFNELEDNNYDIIHTTYYPYFNLIYALIIARKLNIPSICTPFFHFSNPRYLDSNMINVLKEFDFLIACTEIEKRKLHEILNIDYEKIHVIPMGVDPEVYNNDARKHHGFDFKTHYFQKKERNYKMILFCGYKNFEKGAISILKALPKIISKYKKIYFVFIGPSTIAFNRELSRIHKNKYIRVINLTPDNLKGYLDEKKISAFKNSDIYLMPSRSDAFGIAFLEAWAAGKPVIGANIGATPQVIRDNIDGFLVEFGNTDDICKKVLTLLKSKRLRNKFGAAGKVKVLRCFNWQKVVEQTLELYKQIEEGKN